MKVLELVEDKQKAAVITMTHCIFIDGLRIESMGIELETKFKTNYLVSYIKLVSTPHYVPSNK
ncbi:hypothetical protein NQ317_008210 [Molorchus minor]|uniref:Uncharacterized protein n=1 Tax=Molorchus minor TaxID=1323400 RepID=A0ABQ9JWX9_9CUCU|nr:hypothetical protein NQ317_008210 [Molorchus minor]